MAMVDGQGCSSCNTQFLINQSSSISYSSDRRTVTLTLHATSINGATLPSSTVAWHDASSNAFTSTCTSTGSSTDRTYTITFTLNPNYQRKIDYKPFVYLTINGKANQFYFLSEHHYIIWYDNVPPVISNVTQTNLTTSNGWTTSKRFTVTGTDNSSEGVYIKMTDTNGTVLQPYSYVATSNGSYTYSFTPNVEANENTPFIIWVKDNIGNESQKTIYVEKIDNYAPSLTNDSGVVVESLNYLSPWRRNEKVTFKIKDNGVGQVQIAFNNPSDYQVATYNSSTGYYERTYNFYGDVPTQVTGALYTKDGLGNEKMYKINFDKLNSQSGAGEFAFEAQTESIATSVFMGYYTTQSGEGNQIIQSTGYITNENDNRRFVEDSTIYARWGGGTITLPSRSKPGYTFLGWSETEGATEATYTPGETIALSQNKKLYGVWKASNYTVSLIKGTGIASVSGAGTYRPGDTVTVEATLNSNSTETNWTNDVASVGNIRYKKTHTYNFVDWTGDSTSTSQTYTFTMPNSDIVLTANGQEVEGQANRQRYTEHTTSPIYVRVWGDYLNWEGNLYKSNTSTEIQNRSYCSLDNYAASGPYGRACIDIYAGYGKSVSYSFSTGQSGTVSDNHNFVVNYDSYSWDDI